jgi:hypothetical protein
MPSLSVRAVANTPFPPLGDNAASRFASNTLIPCAWEDEKVSQFEGEVLSIYCDSAFALDTPSIAAFWLFQRGDGH